MTHPSKRKGNAFERELVNDAKAHGVEAKRAYASNGESLGHHAEVDIVVGGHRVQCKRRARIAKDFVPSKHVDAVAIRQDRGETLVIVRWSDWVASRSLVMGYLEEKQET